MRTLLVLGALAIHLWTAWIAWTVRGVFEALFTLTVPFLAELVWGAWISWQAGTVWNPYVQVVAGYLALALGFGMWRRWRGPSRPTGTAATTTGPDRRQG